MAKAPRAARANDTTAPASGDPRPRSRPRRKSDAPPARETATLAARPAERVLTDDEIRLRAYERYLERGGTHGMDVDDWVEAERELRSKI